MKKLAILTLALLFTLSALAQKGPDTELGFQPGKLYDFTDIDSVNLFNGNLMLTIPIGPRKQVSSTLAYQIQLVYNGKVWDTETWECVDAGGTTSCSDILPNRRSNAGLGWRISFGRLLPPFSPTLHPKSTDSRFLFVYESPAGDEHAFVNNPDPADTDPADVRVAADASALRLIRIRDDAAVKIYDVEFPTGETHRFEWENGAYRLKQISDRFGNFVSFGYAYDPADNRRVLEQTIVDTTSTAHTIRFYHDPDLNESIDRGAVVDYIDFMGFGGQTSRYDLSYDTSSIRLLGGGHKRASLPVLTEVLQPDGSKFVMSYYSDPRSAKEPVDQGAIRSIRFPTGGSVDYHYGSYGTPPKKTCSAFSFDAGIRRRIISDGNPLTTRTWTYSQSLGSQAPVNFPDPKGDYCCRGFEPSFANPSYWTRTSVLSPDTVDGKWTRTDHWFDAYSFDFTYEGPFRDPAYICDSRTPTGPPKPGEPWLSEGRFAFGYPGTIAAPSEAVRRRADIFCPSNGQCEPNTKSTDAEGRRLTTEVYTGCTAIRDTEGLIIYADCAGAKLERSTHTAYEQHPLSVLHSPYFFAGDNDPSFIMKASKTVYHEDDGCNGDCFVGSESSEPNGTGLYGKVVEKSNFPGFRTKTTTTKYTNWTKADAFDDEKTWITGLYTERIVEDSSGKRRELSCFDPDTGFLERQRVLADPTRFSKNDLLTVFEPSDNGDVAFVKHYGSDKQNSLPETHDCSASLASLGNPWYQIENHFLTPSSRYTGGVLVWSRYRDRTSGKELGFKTADRDVDPYSGAVTAVRDTAGVSTSYGYEATPVRITSVSRTGGTTSTYDYNNATASKNAHVVETVTAGGATIGTNTYEFDGLGRVKRVSKMLPNGKVAVVQTDYDAGGRAGFVTQPIQKDEHPFSDISGDGTSYSYDAFDRQKLVRAPDNTTTTFDYEGIRRKTRTMSVAVSFTGSAPAVVNETYDPAGRLISVEEQSGPGGTAVTTQYTYDVAGNLTEVSTTSDGVTQPRSFIYDGRGFLDKEAHPETQDLSTEEIEYTDYGDYDSRGHAWKRTVGGKTLDYTFDSAERLTHVSGPDGLVKEFHFGTTANSDNGKLMKAIRHNQLQDGGHVDVTEIYSYGGNGLVSSRRTLVQRATIVGDKKNFTDIQQFDYDVRYDEFLQPRTIVMPRCSLNGCRVEDGLATVTNERKAGYLTEVEGFAALTYHPSGMVESVQHDTPNQPTDTYSARNGLPRPSKITFAGCTATQPFFMPGFVRATVDPNACGIQITWPSATLCGGASNIKYRVLRDGIDVTGPSCVTGTKFLDRTAVKGNTYVYTVVAEGPTTEGGTGICQSGRVVTLDAKPFEFKSCDSETLLTMDKVRASVGVLTQFKAKLASANGPIVDQDLVFSVLGTVIGTARTGPTGEAALDHAVDQDPGVYPNGVTVTYAGGLFPAKTTTAELTLVCDAKSYNVRPLNLNVAAVGGIFPILVNTSNRCTWGPTPAPGFLTDRVQPTDKQRGIGTFKIDVPAFEGAGERASFVRVNFDFSFQNVIVEQGSDCTFRFSPSVAYFPYEGNQESSIEISAPSGCAWSVTSNESWVQLTRNSGTGDGYINFRLSRNNGKQRMAVLSLNGGVETAKINQYAPPPVECPVLVTDIEGGGTLRNGQNVSLRVKVDGTYLRYQWYADGRKIRDCEDSGCAALAIGPGQSGYPAPGDTVTYQVVVENSCDGVVSSTVTFHNAGGSCRVPTISDSTFGTNGWPSDRRIPFPGFQTRIFAVVDNWPSASNEVRLQWYSGRAGDRDEPISDADGGKTDEIKVRHPGFYWLEATNSCGSQISRNAAVFLTDPPPRIRRRAARKDFTGDLVSDLLWQNRVTGQIEVWQMNGTERTSTVSFGSHPNPNAMLQSVGDIDDDGRTDLIFRDPQTGQNEVWLMSLFGRRGSVALEARSDPRWVIGAVADLDNDYSEDIVWHNQVTGENEIWFQQGSAHEGTWALPSNGGPGWGLHGTEDFNFDGRPDLFFHNRNTGQNSIWLMNDAERGFDVGVNSDGSSSSSSSARRFSASVQPMASMPDTNWIPALVADMNNDSRPDIVWRNVVTGENSVWLMFGTNIQSTVPLEARTDPNWQIGGGGSTNAGNTGGGGDPRTSTSVSVVVDPARVGTATAVTATLTAGGTPLAKRQLVFVLNGNEAARLLTDAAGSATAALSVAGLAAGTYTNAVTVRFDGDNVYNSSTASANLVITAAPANVTWANPAPIVYGTPLSAAQLNATADVPGAFVYSPAAGAILNAGFQTLSVTFTPADTTLAPVTKQALLTVEKAPSSVMWTKPVAITYGVPLSETQLNATSSLAGTFTYDPEPGTLLPVGAAQTLRVTFAPDSANYAPSAATTTIDVTKGSQIIRWNDPPAMSLGDPLTAAQLNATVITSGSAPAGAMTYTPPAGTVLPEGIHELKVSVAETEFYLPAAATVDVVVSRSAAQVTWSDPAPIVYGTPLSATQLNATANVPGTFTYTPGAGTILNAGTEKLAVVFTPADSRYQSTTAFVTITVRKATPVATWSAPAPIVYGTPLSSAQLNATTNVVGEFAYTPAAGTILDAGTHELTARFIPGDTRNYESVTMKLSLEVGKAAQTVVWPKPAAIVYGTALSATQLNATVQVVGPAPAGAVTYSPAAGTVLSAGPAQVLSVSVAATANYHAATSSVTLDVLKATPVITWAKPAPIVYKTPLGAAQLNATANVPGAFVYSPAAGTLLEAGLHPLAAQFTPNDTANYNNAAATTDLEVQRANPVLAWTRPAGIVYGTPLSSTQLNATADVPGAFAYTPAAATILNAGAGQALKAHFTPSDTRNYNEGDVSTTIDVAKAPQKIVWAAPAPIVYGTPLSSAQLNATVEVVGPAPAGALTYTPAAGKVLDAGAGQTLSVAVAETANYLPNNAPVTIDVRRAPLSLTADAKSKLYGDPVPPLTGVVTGVVNDDPITASYATTATQQSVTGTYPITATFVDPKGRLVNYDVTVTPSTLTVRPAPLVVSANAASKQYSDPLPQLTATFTGLVLGETPAVLGGVLSIQTTAERLSAPGTYPITIGGLTSTNYAITFVGSTFTVTPEDARVVITSPLLVGGARTGATALTLSATVQDISATAAAAGDADAGDIRKATLTFVDRATGATLCTATIGLLVPSDERTGVATCTFTRDLGATLPANLTVGARVGGYYTRDAAADDAVMTIAAPTEDSVTGGGGVEVATSAGAFAPQTGTRLRFNVNLQYDKNAALKGQLTFTFSRTEGGTVRQYELVGNPGSLSIRRTSQGGAAAIVGTGTLRDVTVSSAPVVIADAAPLLVTASDAGEPSVDDAVSVVLFKREGGLWLATGWDGLRAVEQRLREGNVTVHGKK